MSIRAWLYCGSLIVFITTLCVSPALAEWPAYSPPQKDFSLPMPPDVKSVRQGVNEGKGKFRLDTYVSGDGTYSVMISRALVKAHASAPWNLNMVLDGLAESLAKVLPAEGTYTESSVAGSGWSGRRRIFTANSKAIALIMAVTAKDVPQVQYSLYLRSLGTAKVAPDFFEKSLSIDNAIAKRIWTSFNAQ